MTLAARVNGLVAHTTSLDDVELLAVAGDDGVLFWQEEIGLAGRGVAAAIDLPVGLDDVGGAGDGLRIAGCAAFRG